MSKIATKNAVITGLDIIRGLRTKKSYANNISLAEVAPWHDIPAQEKTDEWKMWVADFYDMYGWQQVLRNHKKILKNRKIVAGELDMEDYIINPDANEFSQMIGIIPPDNNPLQQFYDIAPSIIHILTGEFIQKDNRILVKAVDEFSVSEALQDKEDRFRELLIQTAISDKQAALYRMGLIPDDSDPAKVEEYNKQIDAEKQLAEIEAKFKSFRSQAELWGQHVTNINREAQKMDELEKQGFVESLTNSKVYFHLDMKEDTFKTELIDNALLFSHNSHGVTYASEGDYIGWFEYMTIGDVIHRFGTHPDMDQEKLERLKESTVTGLGMMMDDNQKTFPGAYYDTSKPYPLGKQDKNIVEGITQHNIEQMVKGPSSHLLKEYNKRDIGDPRPFKVMRCYVRSLRKMGYLTKVNRAGETEYQGWVDENFKETIEPVYDNSIIKLKLKDNLLYGEHVDWEWVNEWRHFIKITHNLEHGFWRNQADEHNIYLDGNPCKFQFKGKENPYECLPPIEGCEFRLPGIRPISLIDRIKPWQIVANIYGNKIPKAAATDWGVFVAMNNQMMPRSFADNAAGGDPIDDYIDSIKENKLMQYTTNREQMEMAGGQVTPPQVINASNVNEALLAMQMYQAAKEECFESVGISRQRRAQTKPYENATNIQSGIQFSETQTLPYFHQFSNELMSRVYQRQLEASQYFASTKTTASAYYMNSKEDNQYVEIAGTDLLHRHLHVYATGHPRVKEMEKQLKQLLLNDNTMQVDLLTKVKGFTSETSTKYIQELQLAKAQQEQMEEQRFQQEQETMKQVEEMRLTSEREQRDLDDLKQRRELESKERIAAMQLAGSSEAVPNLPDPSAAVSNALKATQIQSQIDTSNQKLAQDRQIHTDEVLLRRQEIEEKRRAKEIDLQIAKENKNASDRKK